MKQAINEPVGLEIIRNEISHFRALACALAGYMETADHNKFIKEILSNDLKEVWKHKGGEDMKTLTHLYTG